VTSALEHPGSRPRRWLARLLARALRSMRLDSAREASLGELRLEVEELRASRVRLVTAADAERRRIERELHDGTQQHLVALAVNLQLARQLGDSNPAEAKKLLEEIGGDVRDALESVRALAYGVYPPLLLDRGLADALRAAASGAGIATRVEATALDRHPPEVEATVYFCCLEALQNAAEYAGAGARATVRVWHDQGALLFEVSDDGTGFEQRAKRRSVDLVNTSDRLRALGGRLTISSDPGGGTRVSGAIPFAS
jgi:signal transduction histidine kinase